MSSLLIFTTLLLAVHQLLAIDQLLATDPVSPDDAHLPTNERIESPPSHDSKRIIHLKPNADRRFTIAFNDSFDWAHARFHFVFEFVNPRPPKVKVMCRFWRGKKPSLFQVPVLQSESDLNRFDSDPCFSMMLGFMKQVTPGIKYIVGTFRRVRFLRF